VHVKSTGELIRFGFSDHSVRSLVSANRSAKTTSLFGWSLVSVWLIQKVKWPTCWCNLSVRA